MTLPSHIPINIDTSDIRKVRKILEENDYNWTYLQIVKPNQLYGLVKEIPYNGQKVDHHVRCYKDGTITSEIELRRLKDLWLHLTSHSISAHEWVIDILDSHKIDFHIDEDLRRKFQVDGPTEFRRDYLEFFRWLIFGVLFWTPIGYMWKFFTYFTASKTASVEPEESNIVKKQTQVAIDTESTSTPLTDTPKIFNGTQNKINRSNGTHSQLPKEKIKIEEVVSNSTQFPVEPNTKITEDS